MTNETARNQATHIFPGGVNSPVRAFRRVGGTPLTFARGKGPWLFDIEGKSYLDFNLAWGSLILGHAPPKVVKAVSRQAREGSSFGAPTLLENRLGSMVQELVPSLELLRFVSSGTEAVMSAIRLARAVTHRDLIVKFDGCYHGHGDSLLVAAGSGLAEACKPDSEGVPLAQAALTVSLPYNDLGAISTYLETQGHQVAAILVEPLAANMGLVLAQGGFLQGLRKLATQYGAILIFDEVITGFRVHPGGAQGLYGIKPDLSTFGKIIGGGLPAAAFGGKKEIMELLAPLGPVYQAGTLSGNPLAMAAGIATLEQVFKKRTFEALEIKARYFIEGLQNILESKGFVLPSQGSIFGIFASSNAPKNWTEVEHSQHQNYGDFFHKAKNAGLYFSPSPFESHFISCAHTSKDLEWALRTVERIYS